MDDAKIFLRTALVATALLFAGCSLTPFSAPTSLVSTSLESELPAYSPPRNLHDPFLQAAVSDVPAPEEIATEASASKIAGPAAVSETTVESDSAEPVAEADETYRAGLAEQEAILSKDAWARNLVLDRWIDNDMKDPFPGSANSSVRQRAESMGMLNLSDKDRAKRQNRQSVQYVTGLPSTWRWFHNEMEQLASVPAGERTSSKIFLSDPVYAGKKHRLLRANAAILMGRDGDQLVAEELLSIVSDKNFRTELRCAAVETLGKLQNVPAETLIALMESFKETERESFNPQAGFAKKKTEGGIPLLWQELLFAVAEKMEPWEHACFIEPLYAQVYETRLAAARLWRLCSQRKFSSDNDLSRTSNPHPHFTSTPGQELPPAFLENVNRETGELVRVELIRTLGYWRVPDILERIGGDLNRTALLRQTALDALAEANCREAISVIKPRLKDIEPGNRAQAVAALRKFGELDDVFRLAGDTDAKVRIEVAKALSQRQTTQGLAVAKKFMAENNERLQQAVLDAVATWPIPQRGEILLEAAKSPVPGTRRRAVEALQSFGVDTGFFDAVRQPTQDAKQHERLVQSFQDFLYNSENNEGLALESGAKTGANNISPNDPMLEEARRGLDEWRKSTTSPKARQAARERLSALGARLLPYLSYLYESERRNIPVSLDEVLAEVDPLFAAIVMLDSDDPVERRKGAAEIKRTCAVQTPSLFACERILHKAVEQDDTLVLTPLLAALVSADETCARCLAKQFLESESAELRRQACDFFSQCGGVDDLPALIPLLYEPNREVLRGGLIAVVAIFNGLDDDACEEMRKVIAPVLETRLREDDLSVQLDVAAALHRLGGNDSGAKGTEALFRLAASSEPGTKIAVAKTMAALEDDVFAHVLIRYLDDTNGSVRRAALDGLPRLAGKDYGLADGQDFASELSPSRQRAARWKKWYEETIAAQSDPPLRKTWP